MTNKIDIFNPDVTVIVDDDGELKIIYYPASIYINLKDKLGHHLVFAGKLETVEAHIVLSSKV